MKAIQELQVWITENLGRKLSVQVLADRVAMSVRNFERMFTRESGRTPSRYILQMRVEAAQRQLERTHRGLKQALDCGFGNVDVMRRSFVRLIGATPSRRTLSVARAGDQV